MGVKSDGSGFAICFIGTQFAWSTKGNVVNALSIRSNFDPSLGSGDVTFLGFVPPESFTPDILQLFANRGIDILEATGIVRPVIIDIKPGGVPNSINPSSRGAIPVAILSNSTFDAVARIDQTSLTFGHTGDESSIAFCNIEDVNADSLLDLVCHFYTQNTGFLSGDTVGVLKGKTIDGISIFGKDSVNIVPK